MTPPPVRFSLAILMAFIGVIAVGLGEMRLGSWLAVRLSLIVTLTSLLVGLLGAIVRRDEGAWVGFALFGWIAFGLSFMPPIDGNPTLRLDPAAELVDRLAEEFHPQLGPGPALPQLNAQFMQMTQVLNLTQLETDPRARSLLSPTETAKYDDWIGRWHAHEDSAIRSDLGRYYAKVIGHALFALLFGLFGAVAGRSLERPREPRIDPNPTGA